MRPGKTGGFGDGGCTHGSHAGRMGPRFLEKPVNQVSHTRGRLIYHNASVAVSRNAVVPNTVEQIPQCLGLRAALPVEDGTPDFHVGPADVQPKLLMLELEGLVIPTAVMHSSSSC